jgi:LysM repeat protein
MIYTVKPGDSLSKIARDVLGDINRFQEIAILNKIANVNAIYPGQVLQLPLPTGTTTFVMPPKQTQPANLQPEQTEQKASYGWIGGLLLLLIGGGYVYKNWKEKKAK